MSKSFRHSDDHNERRHQRLARRAAKEDRRNRQHKHWPRSVDVIDDRDDLFAIPDFRLR